MPAFATHYLFLEEMREPLEKACAFDLDETVAGVGTQGPDIFIFHRLWPPVTIYKSLFGTASKLHRDKPDALFDAFADYLKISKNPHVARSYIYGFILHYALDRNCHPYVYARQNAITDADAKIHPLAAHNRVEHGIDTYLLNRRKGLYPPSLFDPAATFTSDPAELAEIGELMQCVIRVTCGKDVPQKEVIKAVTDTADLQAMLANKNGKALKIAHAIETPLGPVCGYFKMSASIKPEDLTLAADCANEQKAEWTSPYSGETSTESFEELFEKSKPDALALLKGFDALCEGKTTAYDVTGNLSFLTGLEVTEE